MRRILLLHAVILSIGGIPLIWATRSARSTTTAIATIRARRRTAAGSTGRPRTGRTWPSARMPTIQGRIYQQLQHLVHLRRTLPALGGAEMDVINVGTDHVFGFVRNRQ
ncbi:MAG: hypothetical protein R2838_08095 [Caldilineaceae bacterium]